MEELVVKGMNTLYHGLKGSNVFKGVNCDSCQNDTDIRGLRFKCESCRDYDLCYNCFVAKK